MFQDVRVLLENKIMEGGGSLTLSPQDTSDALFQKALLAAGGGEGWCLQLSNAVLTDASVKKAGGNRFTFQAENVSLQRNGKGNEAVPFRGFSMELEAIEIGNWGTARYMIRFFRKETDGAGQMLKELFPNLAPTRTIDGGAMVLMSSLIGDIRLEEECYYYDTDAPDLEKEPDGEDYPQPLLVYGWLNLKESTVRKRYPFFPERMRLEGDGEASACMLRFFDRANPAFRFYAQAEEIPFSFADILLRFQGFGLFLTNIAGDEYATLGDSGIVSQAMLYIKAALCTAFQSMDMFLYSDLFQNAGYWNFSAQFTEGVSINQGLGFLFDIVQVPSEAEILPQDVWALSHLLLREIRISVMEETKDAFLDGAAPVLCLAQIGFLVQSDARWETPVPLLSFDNVGIFLEAVHTGNTYSWHGNLFTDFVFQGQSSQKKGAAFRTLLALPELSVRAWLLEEVEIPLSEALSGFLGHPVYGLPENLRLTDAAIRGSYQNKSLSLRLAIEGDWGFSIGNNRFALTELSGAASFSPGDFSASVGGLAEIQVKTQPEPAVLALSASYQRSGKAWVFMGGLNSGSLELVDFVANFFGTPPEWVDNYAPKITIRSFDFFYSTANGNPMSVSGILEAKLPLSLLGTSFQMQLEAHAEREPQSGGKNTALTGGVQGVVRIGQFALLAAARFVAGEKKPSYTFEFWLDRSFLQASVIRIGGKELLKISLQNMTVGDLASFFGKLVNPNYDFKLEAPWDVLGDIPLSGIELTIDLLEKVLRFTYPFNKNIGIASIGSLGFQYGWGKKQKGFDLILTGSFLGKDYTQEHPLSWDVMNDAPPKEASDGGKFDLSFLAFGEHVTYDGYAQKQVSAALAAMKSAMSSLNEENPDPFSSRKVSFDAATGLVLGLEAKLAGFIRLQAVLKQPDLYGGLLTLSGNGAGSLNGLSVELLYTAQNGIGCFSITFLAPYRFRRLSFGSVTLELGQIAVQIYTNGGFMVDLGFPHNLDFHNSFGLEVFPFKGKGGAYFGVLHGNTWNRLPSSGQGIFSPVIAFGLGLDIGIGKSFDVGILSASVSASVAGVLEGVLAWFHPYYQDKTDFYYHISGSVAVKGSLWGKVDFFVIAVTVGVNISAGVNLTLQSAESTTLVLWIDVEAYASVRIIFVKVSFSFHIHLSVDFVFGKSQSAPWKNALGAGAALPGIHRKSPRQKIAAFAACKRDIKGNPLDYRKSLSELDAAKNAEAQVLQVWLTPFFTVKDIKVQVTTEEPAQPSQNVCFFLALPDEKGDGEAVRTLAAAFLQLNLNAIGIFPGDAKKGEDPVIRWDHLKYLEKQLSDIEASYGQFTVETIVKTLQAFGISFEISYPGGDAGEGNPADGTAFPMPPVLTGIWQKTGSSEKEERNYAEYGYVDAEYVAWLRRLYGSFYDQAAKGRMDALPGSSMAEHTFRGYFYMLSRITVQKGLFILENLSCQTKDGQTLRSVCESYPWVDTDWMYHEKDSIEDIAQNFGMTGTELLFLNPSLAEDLPAWEPGKIYTIKLGPTPQALLRKNPGWHMKEMSVSFPFLPCVSGRQDTIRRMTERAGGSLSLTIKRILNKSGLLSDGKEFSLSGVTVELPHTMLLDLWAVVFYVRIFQPVLPQAEWYYEAILSLNKDQPEVSCCAWASFQDQNAAAPGYLIIPAEYGRTEEESLLKWKVLPGDTPRLIASYCALYQSSGQGKHFLSFLGKVRQMNGAGVATQFILPETRITIFPGETLGELAVRLFFVQESDVSAVCAAAASFADLSILKAGQTLEVAEADLPCAGETVQEFADKWRIPFSDFAELIQEKNVLSAETVELPVLYGLSLSQINEELYSEQNRKDISGLLSRFLWNGQVVPERFENGQYVNLMGLYEKTGQQFPVQPDNTLSDSDQAYTFTLQKNEEASWAVLSGGTVEVDITNAMILQNCPDTVLSHVYLERKALEAVEHELPEFLLYELEDWERITGGEEKQTGENQVYEPFEIAYFPEGFGLYQRKAAIRKKQAEEEAVNGKAGADKTEISGVRFAAAAALSLTGLSDTLYSVRPADESSLKILKTFGECGEEAEIHLLFEDASESRKWISQPVEKEKTLLFDLNGNDVCAGRSVDFVKLLCAYGISGQMTYLHLEGTAEMKPGEEKKCLFVLIFSNQEGMVSRAANCAVLPGYLDRSREQVYAVEKDGQSSAVALFPIAVGTAGYGLVVERPEEDERTHQARQIYSLASFQIEEEPFSSLNLLLPMFPQTLETDRLFQGIPYAKKASWRYPVQLKLAEAVEAEEEASDATRPSASDDPYRGIAYARRNGWSTPYQVTVKTVWHDLAGNRSEPEPALSVEFGYSDCLKPPLSYEAVTGVYWIGRNESTSEAAIFAALHFDCGAFMPDGGGMLSPDRIGEAVRNLEQAYYQVLQEDIGLSLSCTVLLNNAPLSIQKLRDFLASAWSYLKIIENDASISCAEGQTAEDLCETYGMDYEGLARANLDVTLKTLFGSSQYSIPEMAAWKEGDTLEELCGKEASVYACGYNLSLPLRAGILLASEARSVTYAGTGEAASLSQIAKALGIPALSLAKANASLNGVWKGKTNFEYHGYSVLADENDSLAELAESFQKLGVSVKAEELAMEYEDALIWKPELTLSADVFAAEEGMTLASAAEALGTDGASLAGLNLSTANLFAAGTMLVVAETSVYEQQLSFDEMSLEEAGTLLGIKPQTLLYLNRKQSGKSFRIPGHVDVSWPEAAASSYFEIGESSFHELARKQGVDAAALFYANQAVTGIIKENVVLTVKDGDKSYQVTTKREDTLASLPIRFSAAGYQAEPEEILVQNGDAELLNVGKHLFFPVELEWEASLSDQNYPSGCFALEAGLLLERHRDSMHSEAVDTEAQKTYSVLPPLWEGDSYASFAARAKEVLPELFLCTAGEEGGGLWAVVVDDSHFGSLAVSPHKLAAGSDSVSMPMYYSLRPLAQEFLSRSQVSVPGLEPDGTLSYTETEDFTEIDLDRWADDFLEAMDWMMKPELLERLLGIEPKLAEEFYAVRNRLLQAISEGLGSCLQPLEALGDEAKRLEAAKAAFLSRSGHSLSDIVSGGLVLQYDAVSCGNETLACDLDGSVCLPEAEGQNDTSAEVSIYGSGVQKQGTDAAYYQHFFLDAGNQYRLSQLSLEGLFWQTAQWEATSRVLKPVLSETLDKVSIHLASEVPAPLFLRRVPEAPALLFTGEELEADFSKLLSWVADYRLHLPVRVQDTVTLKLLCNVAETDLPAENEKKDLFGCLAGFRAVCGPLKECIKEGDDTAARNAFASWIVLAKETAECWQEHWNGTMQKAEREDGIFVLFTQSLVWEKDTPFLILTRGTQTDDLQRSMETSASSRHPAGNTWTDDVQRSDGQNRYCGNEAPEIGYPRISCGTAETEMKELILTEKDGYAQYAFPKDWEVNWEKLEGLFFAYRFPIENILHVYNVQLEAQAKRNAALPECGRSLSKFLKVNEEFIYTTPVCGQEGCSEPPARLEKSVDGGNWGKGEQNPLKPFFEKLENGNVVDCVVDYSFQNGSFRTRLPAAGFFHKTVQGSDIPGEIETELAKWRNTVNPGKEEAKWHFCLRVYDGEENARLMADYQEICFKLLF